MCGEFAKGLWRNRDLCPLAKPMRWSLWEKSMRLQLLIRPPVEVATSLLVCTTLDGNNSRHISRYKSG